MILLISTAPSPISEFSPIKMFFLSTAIEEMIDFLDTTIFLGKKK